MSFTLTWPKAKTKERKSYFPFQPWLKLSVSLTLGGRQEKEGEKSFVSLFALPKISVILSALAKIGVAFSPLAENRKKRRKGSPFALISLFLDSKKKKKKISNQGQPFYWKT